MEKTERQLRAEPVCVVLYLTAIVAANFAVAQFGQVALLLTAVFLVPFDLVTRDILHESWSGSRSLWIRMASLIATGSILSAVLSISVSRVALASFIAFAASGFANAGVYHILRRKGRLLRMNASNAVAAVVDSVVFPVIAFEEWAASLAAGQALLKFSSGVVLSVLYIRWMKR